MDTINSIEKRLPWSLFGFLLGAISLVIAIGIYILSKQDEITNVRFYIDEESSLVEMKDKFPKIKILFNDVDILESKQEIMIIRLRLVNEGQTILQPFYDNSIPFGLTFKNSRIITVTPISPTTGYLVDNLFLDDNPDEYQQGRLLFNKPIIEKGSQLSFKVYLIKNKDSQ